MMIRNNNSRFGDKFNLLNSQESNPEINWSSTESSDYENVQNNKSKVLFNHQRNTKKRKRKKKLLKSDTNLDITIKEVTKESKYSSYMSKSPIISVKSQKTCTLTSPIIKCSQNNSSIIKCNEQTSPIIFQKNKNHKSPLLTLKRHSSSSQRGRTKRKLFKSENIDLTQEANSKNEEDLRKSPVLINQNRHISRRKQHRNTALVENVSSEITTFNTIPIKKNIPEIKLESISLDESILMEISQKSIELQKNIKSFFSSNFSSDSFTQPSISENQTPNEEKKSFDDIELVSTLTQIVKQETGSVVSINIENKTISSSSNENFLYKLKKTKYKKGGLADRLNTLLKKQTAKVNLWEHEKYLAANSSFVMPKGETFVLHVLKVIHKYGCYLLEAMGINDDRYLVLISSSSLREMLMENAVLKIYEPYILVDYNETYKLVLNVCKYECIQMKDKL